MSQHKWLSHVFIGVNEAFKYKMRQLQADQLESRGRKLWIRVITLDKGNSFGQNDVCLTDEP